MFDSSLMSNLFGSILTEGRHSEHSKAAYEQCRGCSRDRTFRNDFFLIVFFHLPKRLKYCRCKLLGDNVLFVAKQSTGCTFGHHCRVHKQLWRNGKLVTQLRPRWTNLLQGHFRRSKSARQVDVEGHKHVSASYFDKVMNLLLVGVLILSNMSESGKVL